MAGKILATRRARANFTFVLLLLAIVAGFGYILVANGGWLLLAWIVGIAVVGVGTIWGFAVWIDRGETDDEHP